ncbi:MAG: DUF4249 family protein [Ignavibacteriae bacterium]|nr:DUF4249 family protein [Ignavibacteriota bacterium]MCB9216598.1 DUF4249 family protein [Ignavibacteria bacterium]
MKRTIITLIAFGAVIFAGCEDPIPTDYIPEYVFTGYLIVDEPVKNITLTRSLEPLDSFEYSKATVADAVIRIWNNTDTFDLVYVPSDTGVGSYQARDLEMLVKPGTEYFMEATIPDGSVLTSSTVTPERIEWLQAPREMLQYPIDTLNLPSPDSLKLIWTPSPGVTEYLISVEALDTLNYGSYLEPPTGESNRRIERFFEDNAPRYNDVVRWGFLQNTQVNVVWFAFKWFGQHEITVYAPDPAMLEWFKQVRFGGNQFQSLLSNIEGGVGVLGSASVARQNAFLLKNQP